MECVEAILVLPLWPHMAWFPTISPRPDRPPWELLRLLGPTLQGEQIGTGLIHKDGLLIPWQLFTAEREFNQVDPHFALVQQILQFSQSQLEAQKAAVTPRGSLAAIKQCGSVNLHWVLRTVLSSPGSSGAPRGLRCDLLVPKFPRGC